IGITQEHYNVGMADGLMKSKITYKLIEEGKWKGYHLTAKQTSATLVSMIDWNEELRSRIGVMNYIHQRTRISRSVVAEVLAALRKGGYIEMNKGKLVAINRLPSEY
ncbi:transcriptional regulator, partial [Shigella flexneri]|uniref:helix-turn-helix domain-containing protein n=1 Tax=Shigella flexneri TaxID=623 RepID=UPI0012E96AFB